VKEKVRIIFNFRTEKRKKSKIEKEKNNPET
jgi:hypothetical protein